jgi:TolB-like protein/DNA-binding winged helix-turn-helix (wHTH) protein
MRRQTAGDFAGVQAKFAESRHMDALGSLGRFAFEGFRFDLAAGGLFRTNGAGAAEPVALSSRALALLALFVERPGQLVSKDEIFAAVWPGSIVGEGNLTVQISALRRVLDDDRAHGTCIQTIPGRGYRFIPAVTRIEADNIFEPGLAEPLSAPSVQMTGALSTLRLISGRLRLRGSLGAVFVVLSLIAITGVAGSRLFWLMGERPTQPPSIAILPFVNLGNDPSQQALADGITEDLTTDVARLAYFRVISRDTAYTFKDRPTNVEQLGRELGVRYVLEGSVQRARDSVRVNAQLINAETDRHLWSERFDRDDSDLLTMQNEIAGRLANGLTFALVKGEAARPSERLDGQGYIFRGQVAFAKFNPQQLRAGSPLF